MPPLPDVLRRRATRTVFRPAREVAFAKSLGVLYEDDEVLVLNKPAGSRFKAAPRPASTIGPPAPAGTCLRARGWSGPGWSIASNRDISRGAEVLGKSPGAAASSFAGAFYAWRRAVKTYWAIVWGVPEGPARALLNLPLVKKGVGDREMVIPTDPKDPDGEPAERLSSSPSPARRAPRRRGWRSTRTLAAPTSFAPTCLPWGTQSSATRSTQPTSLTNCRPD